MQSDTVISLVPISKCPVCGGEERIPFDGESAGHRAGFHYLKHTFAPLGLSLDEFALTVKSYQCASCKTCYCDPWLSRELAATLFCEHAPDHIAGWANFEHWLSSANPNADQRRNLRLETLLATRLGPVSSYAEFGCPFQGFMLEMRSAELSPPQRLRIFAKALQRAPDVRWTRVTRLYHRVASWAAHLTLVYLRMRALKERFRTKSEYARLAERAEMNPTLRPAKRTLITQDSTLCWGSNCTRYGFSCRYFASSVLCANVVPFSEALGDPPGSFDLVGIFNILDHTRSPIEVIRSSLKMAQAVLVVTHSAALAGKQHLYAFADNFPVWLRDELKGVTVEDLTPQMDEDHRSDYRYILLSRGLEK